MLHQTSDFGASVGAVGLFGTEVELLIGAGATVLGVGTTVDG